MDPKKIRIHTIQQIHKEEAQKPRTTDTKSEHLYDGDGVFTPAPTVNPTVQAMTGSNLYLEGLGDGRHRVTCPWANEHLPTDGSDAVYAEPDTDHEIGQFNCAHHHPEARTVAHLVDHLGLSPAAARAKPRVRLHDGQSHRVAVGSERLLADEGSYFHTGGPIVRIKRDGERASVELVNDHTLTAVLADRAYWERKGRGNDWTRCDPPPHVVRAVRLGQDRPHLLNLSGLAHQPFYGADGSLVTTPGYDEGTGLYATFNRADFTLKDPTREEAIYALDYLKWLLREFFFVSEKDMAAALSAILTAAVRPTLDQAPAFNISATQSGSGKSHLAKLIVLVATPDEAFNTTYPEKDEEAKKVLLAMLLQKPSAIVFDDMQGSWKPLGPLNRALTSATTTERILGSSQTATARTNTLILGTGNGTEPEGDMRRRVVSIYLDPKGKKAALHRYSKDEPVSHTRKNRGSVVVAALTIIEAFRAAGQPFAEVPPIGTFEEWSAKCRHPLIWLGEPDPAESLIEQVRQDPDGDLLEELLDIWSDLFGTRSVTVRKVIEKTAERPDLLDVLADLNLLDGRTVNPGRFGWYLKKNRGRRVGCFRIEPGESLERRSWRVIIN